MSEDELEDESEDESDDELEDELPVKSRPRVFMMLLYVT